MIALPEGTIVMPSVALPSINVFTLVLPYAFSCISLLVSLVISFTSVKLLLRLNALPVVVKFVSGVTVFAWLLVSPKNMLPSFKLGVSFDLKAPCTSM